MTASEISSPRAFWDHVVVPDYTAFLNDQSNLRLAFHCATSLFHMADWIYVTHRQSINASFTHSTTVGVRPVSNEVDFANSLRDAHPDFELIRRVANTAKHLSLRGSSPHTNAPSHAANTTVQPSGFGEGAYGQRAYGGEPRVVIANHPGLQDIDFAPIATSVFDMWQLLRAQHGW